MNKIPTAVEFAKLHVQAQAKTILEKTEFRVEDADEYKEVQDSILNAYPLNLIK